MTELGHSGDRVQAPSWPTSQRKPAQYPLVFPYNFKGILEGEIQNLLGLQETDEVIHVRGSETLSIENIDSRNIEEAE